MLLSLGCARQFQPLAVETRSFSQSNEVDGIVVAYDTFDIFAVSHNRRYAKKSRKKNIRLVPVRITNTGDEPVTIQPADITVFSNNTAIRSAPAINYLRKFRQVTLPYLLYAIGDFSTGSSTGTRYNYLFPVFTAWGVSNVVIAAKSNQAFKEMLQRYTTLPNTLAPGRTIYYMLGIPAENDLHSLYIRYVRE